MEDLKKENISEILFPHNCGKKYGSRSDLNDITLAEEEGYSMLRQAAVLAISNYNCC